MKEERSICFGIKRSNRGGIGDTAVIPSPDVSYHGSMIPQEVPAVDRNPEILSSPLQESSPPV